MILVKDNSPGIFDKPARQQASNNLKKDEVRVAASESRSLQFRCAKYLVSSGLDDVIEGTFVLLSLSMVGLYTLQTYYTAGTPEPIKISELIFTCLFIVEYLIRFYISEKRLSFFFSINSIIMVLILVPTFLYRTNIIKQPTEYPLKILVLLKVLFIFGLYRMEKIFARRGIEVGRKLWRLMVSLLSILVIFAALVQQADNHSKHLITNSDGTPIGRRQFHEELYFLIITMATVGFGDLAPASELSRLFIFVVIFAILAVVPVQFQDYFKAVSLTSRFTRISYKKPKKAKHILLLGDFTHVALKTFLNELYHADHGHTQTHTVILLQKAPSQVLTNSIMKQHKGKVFLLGGSAFNKADLKRTLAEQAVCVVILANKLYNTPLQEDYRNIMLAMAVKKYGFMHQKDL